MDYPYSTCKMDWIIHIPMRGHIPMWGHIPTWGHVPIRGYIPVRGHIPARGYIPVWGHIPIRGYIPIWGHIGMWGYIRGLCENCPGKKNQNPPLVHYGTGGSPTIHALAAGGTVQRGGCHRMYCCCFFGGSSKNVEPRGHGHGLGHGAQPWRRGSAMAMASSKMRGVAQYNHHKTPTSHPQNPRARACFVGH